MHLWIRSWALYYIPRIRDIGVLIDERLAFSNHIQDKINKAYAISNAYIALMNELFYEYKFH